MKNLWDEFSLARVQKMVKLASCAVCPRNPGGPSPPRPSAHSTLAPPSAARPRSSRTSKTPHTHTLIRTHTSPYPARGQTASWRHTRRPSVDTHTHAGTPRWKRAFQSVFLLPHVGLINTTEGRMSVLPSVPPHAARPPVAALD